MHRSILVIATFVTLGVTGFVMYRLNTQPARFPGNNVTKQDPLASSAGLRFRQSQSTHWRDVMMQR